MDALWDATIYLRPQRNVCMIAFPADSAPALTLEWYANRGFTPRDYRGVTIYAGSAKLLPHSIVSLHGQQAVALLAERYLLLLSDTPENLQRVLDADAGTGESFLDHPATYEALAFGYRYEAGEPVTLYGFAYADPALAAADAPIRKALAAKGLASRGQQPYSKYIFTPVSSEANGAMLLVRLRSATERLKVYELMAKREMLVAACP
jgi:hypothetical protein